MRVLHVLHNSLPLLCGYSIRSGYIVRLQRAQGLMPMVVTSAQNPNGAQPRDVIDGVVHLRTQALKSASLPLWRELKLMRVLYHQVEHAIAEFTPDVIHAHSPVLVGLPALQAARRHGIPMVYEIRDLWENASVDRGKFRDGSPMYRAARGLETHVLRSADAVVTICDTLRGELAARIGSEDRLFVVDNGVDVEEFTTSVPHGELVDPWHVAGKQVIAYVGTFQPYEGLDLLIKAMPHIIERVPDAHLLIVGGSAGASVSMEEDLRSLVRDLGLDAQVTFTGRIPHSRVREAYRLASVVAYPRILTRTTALTTPLKPLEAMAMGKAVVASDVAALRELVSNGETGLLFRSGSLTDLAATCATLLRNTNLRERLGREARCWVMRERDWRHLVARYQGIYESVVGSTAPRSVVAVQADVTASA